MDVQTKLSPAKIREQYAQFVRLPAADKAKIYHHVITQIYTDLLEPGMTVVEGGAYEGRHTIPLAKLVGSAGAVYAFEPQEERAETIRYMAVTGEVGRQIVVKEMALFDEVTHLPLYVNRTKYYDYQRSGLTPRDDEDLWRCGMIETMVTTLDTSVSLSRAVDLLLLDLDGAEFKALRGGTKLLKEHGPVIIFGNQQPRSSQAYAYSREAFVNFFTEVSYVVTDLFGTVLRPAVWGHPSLAEWAIAVPEEEFDAWGPVFSSVRTALEHYPEVFAQFI